jgi:hypothetical protein
MAERGERCGRNGVDRIRPDQFFDVKHVAVVRVLTPCARPEYALPLRTFRLQSFPPQPGKDPFVALVRELGVGNGDLAEEAFQANFVGSCCRFQFLVDEAVHDRVDAAHEETGDAGNMSERLSRGRARFQTLDIRARHGLVRVAGEQQCHVDVDPLADQRANCRQARPGVAGTLIITLGRATVVQS